MSAVAAFVLMVLQFEAGARGATVYLYHRVGDDATLPCKKAPPYFAPHMVSWLYNADFSETLYEVLDGNGFMPSPRENRVKLNADLSLVINNITAEDAGRYSCRSGSYPDGDTLVYLSVLTISPVSSKADLNGVNTLKVECSILRTFDVPPCEENSLRWVDETGAVMTRCEFRGLTNCSSVLTVTPQSGRWRTYTCQFVQEQTLKIQDHFSLVMNSTDWSPLSYIMLIVKITGLILMTGITVAVNRGNPNLLKGITVCSYDADEDKDSIVSYENV